MKTVLLSVLTSVLFFLSSTAFAVEYNGYDDDCPKACTQSEKKSGTYWATCGDNKTILSAPKSNDSGYTCWR